MNQSDKIKLSLRIATIAGIFSVIVCVLMLLNFWQLKSTDPLESESLKSMVEQLEKDPRNEALKEDIRRLDLMTRKAYFTKQWQIRTGGALLLAGIIITVVALRFYHSLKASVEVPDHSELSSEIELLSSRKWILYSIVSLFIVSLTAAYFSHDHLASTYALSINEPDVSEDNVVEVAIRTADEESGSSTEAEQKQETNWELIVSESSIEVDQPIVEEITEETETSEAPATVAVVEKKTAFPSHTEQIAQFPAFRGPYGLGISHHQNIPFEWDGASGKNVLWKTPIESPGYNSPVIWNEHLFITGANDKEKVVFCYNSKSGELNWQHTVKDIPGSAGTNPNVTDDTGLAAPTTTTDGNYVYAIFATGDLVCLDFMGNRIWAKNLGVPDNHYGHSSSLLTWGGILYIQYDSNKGGELLALDALTGEQKWLTKRKTQISWSSPILANMGNHYELILTSSPLVAAYDPVTGKELWGLECLSGEVGPSAGFGNDMIYAANEYASLVAIKPGENPEIMWESNEYLPEVSSPVVAEGMIFIATSYGVVACHDAVNGELLWEYEADQGFYASPMIADKKVFIMDMDGIMHIFSLEKTLKLLGTPELGEGSVCTPAFANGRIYLRSQEYLYCIGK